MDHKHKIKGGEVVRPPNANIRVSLGQELDFTSDYINSPLLLGLSDATHSFGLSGLSIRSLEASDVKEITLQSLNATSKLRNASTIISSL